MEEANIIEDPKCPHQRVRVLFDEDSSILDDDTSPLVVRLDDQGHTAVMSGWQGNFNPAPIGYAWKHWGDIRKVCTYLATNYGSRAEVVGTPDPRTFAFVVVAHPGFVETFGGEDEEHPGQAWISQCLAQTVKEVTAYAAKEGWMFVRDQLVTGELIRSYQDKQRADVVDKFADWEETDECVSGFLDYDYAIDQARHYLAGSVLDCRECKRGA
jgi:hypothetical protein